MALALVLMTGALGLAAQSTAPKPATRKPPPASKPDAELEAEIKRRFARSKASEENFTVKVRNGVVTLEGRTDVPQRKGSATRMAKSAGAKQVNNLIQVSEGGRKKAAENLQKRRVKVTRTERE